MLNVESAAADAILTVVCSEIRHSSASDETKTPQHRPDVPDPHQDHGGKTTETQIDPNGSMLLRRTDSRYP